MRAELIGHFEPCMTEIYLHIDARMADYIHTHPYVRLVFAGVTCCCLLSEVPEYIYICACVMTGEYQQERVGGPGRGNRTLQEGEEARRREPESGSDGRVLGDAEN